MGSSTTDWTLVPCIAIARSILNHWTTREVLGVIPPSPPAQENFIFKAEGKELLKMGRTLYWYISLLITVLLFPSYLGQIPQPVKCFICLFVFFIVETNIIVLINYYKCIFYSFLSSFCFRDLKINLTKAWFLSNCPQKFTDCLLQWMSFNLQVSFWFGDRLSLWGSFTPIPQWNACSVSDKIICLCFSKHLGRFWFCFSFPNL